MCQIIGNLNTRGRVFAFVSIFFPTNKNFSGQVSIILLLDWPYFPGNHCSILVIFFIPTFCLDIINFHGFEMSSVCCQFSNIYCTCSVDISDLKSMKHLLLDISIAKSQTSAWLQPWQECALSSMSSTPFCANLPPASPHHHAGHGLSLFSSCLPLLHSPHKVIFQQCKPEHLVPVPVGFMTAQIPNS